MAQRRHEGDRRRKGAKRHRDARDRGGLHARGGHHVHVQSHEHLVAEGSGATRRRQQPVHGVRVYAARRPRQSAAGEFAAAEITELRAAVVDDGTVPCRDRRLIRGFFLRRRASNSVDTSSSVKGRN